MADREQTLEPDWLTLGQAAKYLGVAQSTIRKWSDVGRVATFTTPGGHRRFRKRDLDEFLDNSRPAAASEQEPGPLILIVDDDERLREYVRVNLEHEGYTVREAASAAEGLAVVNDRAPDLILLDVMMPEMDGWELLRHLRERHGIGTVPVIMFSGKLETADAESLGAQGFLGKPFDPQQLIDSTKQLLPV